METTTATIIEQGNGFPEEGNYVPGSDGELYRVVKIGPRIETRGAGAGNCIPGCIVELANWSDCDEGDEHRSRARIDEGLDNDDEGLDNDDEGLDIK